MYNYFPDILFYNSKDTNFGTIRIISEVVNQTSQQWVDRHTNLGCVSIMINL